jgi:hypothetical protein
MGWVCPGSGGRFAVTRSTRTRRSREGRYPISGVQPDREVDRRLPGGGTGADVDLGQHRPCESMMARANLGQLLGNVGEKVPPAVPKPDPVEPAIAAAKAAPVALKHPRPPAPATPTTKVSATAARSEPVTPSPDVSVAPYLRYVRKETRLREDQQNRLTFEARRLNRAKKNPGARITENSLIRVAVDLLLAKIGDAAGDDEDEIGKSIAS